VTATIAAVTIPATIAVTITIAVAITVAVAITAITIAITAIKFRAAAAPAIAIITRSATVAGFKDADSMGMRRQRLRGHHGRRRRYADEHDARSEHK
jgi:hypothetical protein